MAPTNPFQMHHDHWVSDMRQGWLSSTHDRDFHMAKFREAKGEVEPLAMDCKMAQALMDQYFLVSIPSGADRLLRLRDAILQDVMSSHIKPRRGDACSSRSRYLGEMLIRHTGE